MIIEVVGSDLEKLKGEFEAFLNGLNMCGIIDYPTYSKSYDVGTDLIQKAYDLGKKENQPNAEEMIKRLLKGGYVVSGIREKNDNFYTQSIMVAVAESELQRFRELETENTLLKVQIESLKKENLVFHNLIKNPNDLPNNDSKILFFAKDISCVENHYLNRYSLGNYDVINKLFVANSPGYSKDFTITEVLYWWELADD